MLLLVGDTLVALSSWELLRSFRNQLERAQEGSELRSGQLSLFDRRIKRKVAKLTQNFFVNFSLTLLLWTLQLFISKETNIADVWPQKFMCYRFDLLFI